MFFTEAHARQPVHSAFLGEGQDAWSYVRLSLQLPWFFATYRIHLDEYEGHTFCETTMMSDPTQVAHLLDDEDGRGVEVLEVNLVSPPQLNGTAGWKMELLNEVWQGRDPRTGCRYLIYHLLDGKRYCTAPDEADSSRKHELVLVVPPRQANM